MGGLCTDKRSGQHFTLSRFVVRLAIRPRRQARPAFEGAVEGAGF